VPQQLRLPYLSPATAIVTQIVSEARTHRHSVGQWKVP
jgi:hypothetical protein